MCSEYSSTFLKILSVRAVALDVIGVLKSCKAMYLMIKLIEVHILDLFYI